MRCVRPSFNNEGMHNQLVIHFEFYGDYEEDGTFATFGTEEDCALAYATLVLIPDSIDSYALRGETKNRTCDLFRALSQITKPLATENKVGIVKNADGTFSHHVLMIGFVVKNKSDGKPIHTEFDCWVRAAELLGLQEKLDTILKTENPS